MTAKEAIEWLNCLKEIHEDDISDALGTWYKDIKNDHNEVIDMAIEALEKQIKTDVSHTTVCPKCKAPIEIVSFTNFDNLVTDYYPLCHECGWTTRNTYSSKEAAVADIKKLFFTTKDETIGKDTNVPSNDAISRKQAIDALETIGYDFSDSELSEIELAEVCEAVGDVRQDMIRMIKRLPPAQQEPKSPLYYGDGYSEGKMVYDSAECPNCGYIYDEGDHVWSEPYCPHCGQALDWYMRGEQE